MVAASVADRTKLWLTGLIVVVISVVAFAMEDQQQLDFRWRIVTFVAVVSVRTRALPQSCAVPKTSLDCLLCGISSRVGGRALSAFVVADDVASEESHRTRS